MLDAMGRPAPFRLDAKRRALFPAIDNDDSSRPLHPFDKSSSLHFIKHLRVCRKETFAEVIAPTFMIRTKSSLDDPLLPELPYLVAKLNLVEEAYSLGVVEERELGQAHRLFNRSHSDYVRQFMREAVS